MDPDFWSNGPRAELIMKEIKFAKNWLSSFNKAQSAVDDIDVILEFVDLGEATEEELEEKYQLALKEMEEIETSPKMSSVALWRSIVVQEERKLAIGLPSYCGCIKCGENAMDLKYQ